MNLEPDATNIRLRPHAGQYEEQMRGMVYIEEARDALAYLLCYSPQKKARMEELAQRYYGFDPRNGWHTWLITLRASPVLWADRPIPGIHFLDPIAVEESESLRR